MKVWVIGNEGAYQHMFEKLGHVVLNNIEGAELVCFTGGSDVTPEYYGEPKHPATFNDTARDEYEQDIFQMCLVKDIKMVGICRGGQFLNVMNGGAMWQHIKGHAIAGKHELTDVETGETYMVTSTHHQMMHPDLTNGILVAKADHCTEVQGCQSNGDIAISNWTDKDDVESVFYPETSCLCFQPHPEFRDAGETLTYFEKLLKRFFNA